MPDAASAGPRPLAGRTVVVTRPRAQAAGFVEALEALGAAVVEFPTIRIEAPADPEPLARAASGAGGYDWIVFTSVNGVERFWDALRAAGGGADALDGVRVCAIGPATAGALEVRGVRPDVVPAEHVAEAVVAALEEAADLRGARVLLPRAAVARDVLPDGLRTRGAEVDDVAAYRTIPDGRGADALRRRLDRGEVDWVTFTASSTVRSFAELVGTEVGRARVASIGPVTSATARALGLPVHVEAERYTIPGLTAALVAAEAEGAAS